MRLGRKQDLVHEGLISHAREVTESQGEVLIGRDDVLRFEV